MHQNIVKPRVLVVEDEALLRIVVADCFELADFTVLEASQATEAIEHFNGAEQIDLVFTDVRMPGEMDGFALAAWVREHHPETGVVVTSGELGKDRTSADLACIEHFFPKPYELDKVVACIRAHLAKKIAARK